MSLPSNPAKAPAPAAKPSKAYHHGDLRAALIAAAREALETTTPEDITLKSLALRLGVSQPAPYRHFASREALLGAVAADGFERFGAALEAAGLTEETDADGHGAFERACLAYVAFGRANRGVYRLMFASKVLSTVEDEALGRAAHASFDSLLQGVSHLVAPERVPTVAVWIWSTLHGLVMLESEGLMSAEMGREASPEAVVHQMVESLSPEAGKGILPA